METIGEGGTILRVKCRSCESRGQIECPICGGAGGIDITLRTGAWDRPEVWKDCDLCRYGEGLVDCETCEGFGYQEVEAQDFDLDEDEIFSVIVGLSEREKEAK